MWSIWFRIAPRKRCNELWKRVWSKIWNADKVGARLKWASRPPICHQDRKRSHPNHCWRVRASDKQPGLHLRLKWDRATNLWSTSMQTIMISIKLVAFSAGERAVLPTIFIRAQALMAVRLHLPTNLFWLTVETKPTETSRNSFLEDKTACNRTPSSNHLWEVAHRQEGITSLTKSFTSQIMAAMTINNNTKREALISEDLCNRTQSLVWPWCVLPPKCETHSTMLATRWDTNWPLLTNLVLGRKSNSILT